MANELKKQDTDTGLIILGNSGVGKSFLANVVLDRQAFAHRRDCVAVTRVAESRELRLSEYGLTVFDVPGLIEHNQAAIERNKVEIMSAFRARPKCFVLFVFGAVGGRISAQDVVAFKALDAAFRFDRGALALIINQSHVSADDPSLPANYAGETTLLLRQLLELSDRGRADEPAVPIAVVNRVSVDDVAAMRRLRETLFALLVQRVPARHEQHGDIVLDADRVAQLKQEVEQQQARHAEQLGEMRGQVEALEREAERLRNRPQEVIRTFEQQVEYQQGSSGGSNVFGFLTDLVKFAGLVVSTFGGSGGAAAASAGQAVGQGCGSVVV